MHAVRQRGQNRLRVQVIRRGHGHDVEIRKGGEDVVPGFVAVESLWLVSGDVFEGCRRLFCRALAAGGHGDEVKPHRSEIAREFVQPDTGELPRDAEALQVRIRARMHISAEHAGADKGDLDGLFHGVHGRRTSRRRKAR